jgi:hypothetical protein
MWRRDKFAYPWSRRYLSTHIHTNTRLKYGSHMKGLATPSPTVTPHPNLEELNKKLRLLLEDSSKAQLLSSLP